MRAGDFMNVGPVLCGFLLPFVVVETHRVCDSVLEGFQLNQDNLLNL